MWGQETLRWKHSSSKHNIRVCLENSCWNNLKSFSMKIRRWHFTSFNVWVIYPINTFPLILGMLMSFGQILIIYPYSVIIRDKVGNLRQADNKAVFGNESNLHIRAFTHNIFLHNSWFRACSFCSPKKCKFSFHRLAWKKV